MWIRDYFVGLVPIDALTPDNHIITRYIQSTELLGRYGGRNDEKKTFY